MNLDTFFDRFDLFAEAPGAVGKLRELILQFALRGQLVQQDERDGQADTLARRLEHDQREFAKGHRLRVRVFDDVAPDEIPFKLPSNWVTQRFGNLARAQAGFAFASNGFVHDEAGKPIIRIRDITNNHTQANFVGEYREEFLVNPGDYLVGMDGNFTVAKWRGPLALLNQRVSRIQWYAPDLAHDFFAIALQYQLRALQGTKAYTTADHLSSKQIENAVVPLPPLAEQKRIVAKVDELMALCDRVEAQQRERATRHAALTRAALARFDADPTPANLDYLFHPSFAIDPADLRKSILTLAIKGQLVSQNANDQSATVLIETLKNGLPNNKSQNPFLQNIEPSITNESEYPLPNGWCWLPLGHLGVWATGCGFPTQYQGETGKEFMFCKVSDMNLPGNEIQIHSTKNSIDATVMQRIRAHANPPGTVVFPKIGGAIATHKRRLVIKPTIIDNNCSGIQPIGLTDEYWLLLLLQSLDLTKYQSGTSVPAVSQSALDPIRVGLPPLPEQRRIVAKVDELMARVDKLEADLAAARATATRLLDAAVAELTAPSADASDDSRPGVQEFSEVLDDTAATAAS